MPAPAVSIGKTYKIPQIGLGVWKIRSAQQFDDAFKAAIDAGYRHFDTAQAYHNEDLLGYAWQRSNIERNDLFITTKIAVQHFGHTRVKQTFRESLKNLQTDYVDLLLLHFPVPLLRKKAWHTLEEIQAAGNARSIGVSNYTIRHLESMRRYANVIPAVNQVELHVFLQQPELLEYCRDNNILVEAYSPLAHARQMDDSNLMQLAKKYDKSYAQIMLRWCIQQGLVVLPKSVTASRIQENIEIFDFELSDSDMKSLAASNRNMRTCWNPTRVP